MFNKKLIFVSTILTVLMTGCAENTRYAASGGSPTYIECDASYGGTGAVNSAPSESLLFDEDLFHELTTVCREQMSGIPANTSYADVLEKLGNTQAYGQSYYRQYLTEDGRIIQLYFDSEDELCPYSGEELYDRAQSLKYGGEEPKGMIYGILGRGGFFTHYDTYDGKYTDKITGDYLTTIDAEIIFEDGSPASEDDLRQDSRVFVQSDYSLYSYPEQSTALRSLY